MKLSSQKEYVIASTLFCAAAMSVVDGIIQPEYAVKSAIKIVLFLLVPIVYLAWQGALKQELTSLFRPSLKQILASLVLGVLVYAVILGGYYLISVFINISDIVLRLTSDGGVSADNFIWVSVYISFVNSLLEEFFFRGFAFLTLKKVGNRKLAYLFSALTFAGYHFGMIAGSYNFLIWMASMLGLFIAGVVLNYLNEKSNSIYPSWLVHMFANFGINTVGFMIFGMI